jgi:hypothetical protein
MAEALKSFESVTLPEARRAVRINPSTLHLFNLKF